MCLQEDSHSGLLQIREHLQLYLIDEYLSEEHLSGVPEGEHFAFMAVTGFDGEGVLYKGLKNLAFCSASPGRNL